MTIISAIEKIMTTKMLAMAIVIVTAGQLGGTQIYAAESPVFADNNAFDEVNTAFNGFGYSASLNTTNGCRVTMKLDEDTFVKAVPDITAAKLLNPEVVTQTMVNTQPTVVSLIFAMEMASSVIKQTYIANLKVSRCEFEQKLIETDDYGHDQIKQMFTFNFSRILNDKINWDKFDNTKLSKISPQFRFNDLIVHKAAQEHASAE